jgi:phosphatidylserine/phosphatidylglycerophosphate/cardiolipin synthase-like enzyme
VAATASHLLTSYDEVLCAIERLVDALESGDRAALAFYLIEPGVSSERVLEAVRRAAERGARISISLDDTVASLLSRAVERSSTLRDQVLALARGSSNVRARARRGMDHSKYAIATHRDGRSVAIVGGVNLGDRFGAWRDFAVRIEGPGVAADVARTVRGHGGPAWPLGSRAWSLVANVPACHSFLVKPVLRQIARDPDIVQLRFAMAYLDLAGIRILREALARGARVELVLPARPNVYGHANRRALAWLMACGGNLAVHLAPGMLHAKVALAVGRDGSLTALVGSANLKRNSFALFGELVVLTRDATVVDALGHELDALVRDGERLVEPPRYNPVLAAIEDLAG